MDVPSHHGHFGRRGKFCHGAHKPMGGQTMNQTMVDRVAIALRNCAVFGADGGEKHRSPTDFEMKMAAAVISAMREPTEAMLEVGSPLSASQWGDLVGQHKGLRRAWPAMIDAALSE